MKQQQQLKLDPWQEEILNQSGNICLRSGRQVGKSTIISIKAAEYSIKNPDKTILVIASVERQAYLLFEKILDYLLRKYPTYVRKGKYRPTKTKIYLTNGSQINCLPTGLAGIGIRGYTVDLLIADEAAFIPEEVWQSVTPMLAARKKSQIILLSTPHGKQGFYYDRFNDSTFKSFHESSEDCPRIDKEFLAREKSRMTKAEYGQEYLGQFVDELQQFFPTALIKEAMTLDRSPSLAITLGDRFLGVDVARLGGDETVLFAVRRINKEFLEQIDMQIDTMTLITATTKAVLHMDQIYKFKKIYIDDGGLGVGVYDPLREHDQTKRKVVAINNASRSLDHRPGKDPRRKKLLKEDLYANLLNLLETKKIKLFKDPEIFQSLKSIQYEYTEDKNVRIFGNYTHITEALVRAAWCMKDKSLNIFIVSI